jgi:hypothetical protein
MVVLLLAMVAVQAVVVLARRVPMPLAAYLLPVEWAYYIQSL